jgi:hypothetical protein
MKSIPTNGSQLTTHNHLGSDCLQSAYSFQSSLFLKKLESITMGCSTSKDAVDSPKYLDDSIHVALNRDKKKGNAHACYVPRAPHPLLVSRQYQQQHSNSTITCESDEAASNVNSTITCESEEAANNDAEADERIMYHTTIVPRDFRAAYPTRIIKC